MANGVVDRNEVIAFATSSFGGDDGDDRNDGDKDASAQNFRLFDVDTVEAAHRIINWVRGDDEIAGTRNRTVDLDGDGAPETQRVADIVNSPPLAVGSPHGMFEQTRGDASYATFKKQYANRRLVVYSGTNGGLVQAYNGGFFDESTNEFTVTGGAKTTSHPLGAELWAYVPYNLLPHLRTLPEREYTHQPLVDGPVQAFDVKAFPRDKTHPGGWGTILVVGMGLGGGERQVDHDNDAATAQITLRSAYVVMDITDPENPPGLIAEIATPAAGFSTNWVALVTPDLNGNGSADDWALAFGSGPANATSFSAGDQGTAKLFLYDLVENRLLVPAGSSGPYFDSGLAGAFVGGVKGADIGDFSGSVSQVGLAHLGNVTDYIYFGTVAGTAATAGGRLVRFNLNQRAFSTLLAPGQPFSSPPVLAFDEDDGVWVFAGSGRYFSAADRESADQQSFYGLREDADAENVPTETTLSKSSLVDVTDVAVLSDGTVRIGDDPMSMSSVGVPSGADVDSFSELETAVHNSGGWYLDLPVPDDRTPSVRNLTGAALQAGALAFTSFRPSADLCEPLGESELYVLYYKTGTAYPESMISGDEELARTSGTTISTRSAVLGPGYAATPLYHFGAGDGRGRLTVNTPRSVATLDTSEISSPFGPGRRVLWRELTYARRASTTAEGANASAVHGGGKGAQDGGTEHRSPLQQNRQ